LALRVSGLEDSVRRCEGELASSRVRVAQLEGTVRAREAAVDKLSRQLDGARREEADAGLVAARTEEEARRLDGDAATLRARLQQVMADVAFHSPGKGNVMSAQLQQ
jgi:chromosome segregation ATPase